MMCGVCQKTCTKCNLEYCNSCCRICTKCNSAHCANCYGVWYDGNKTKTQVSYDGNYYHYISRCPISGPFKVKAKIKDPGHSLFIGLQLNSGSNQNILQDYSLDKANKGYSFHSGNGQKYQFMNDHTGLAYGKIPGTDEFVIEMIYSASKELSFVVNNQNYGTAFSLGDGHWFLLFTAYYANSSCEIQSVEFL